MCTFLSFVWMHAPLAIRRCASVVAACNRAAALQNVYGELSCRAPVFLSSPPPRHSSFAPPDATISAHDLLPCAGITWGTKVVVQARNSSSLNSSMVRSQQLFSVFRSGFLFASSLRFLTRSLYLLKFSRAILLTFRAVAGKRISTYSICQPHVSVERLSSWCCSCPSLLGINYAPCTIN